MKASSLIAAMVVVAGCGTSDGDTARFEVQSLTVSGALDGHTLDGITATGVTGERNGDVGTFYVDDPGLTMQLSTCSAGQAQPSPYGGGTSFPGRPGSDPTGMPIPEDAGVPGVPGGPLPSADCAGRALYVCASSRCAEFQSADIDTQLVDEGGWRHLTTGAASGASALTVDVVYREAR